MVAFKAVPLHLLLQGACSALHQPRVRANGHVLAICAGRPLQTPTPSTYTHSYTLARGRMFATYVERRFCVQRPYKDTRTKCITWKAFNMLSVFSDFLGPSHLQPPSVKCPRRPIGDLDCQMHMFAMYAGGLLPTLAPSKSIHAHTQQTSLHPVA